MSRRLQSDSGQVSVLFVGCLVAMLVAALVLVAVARGVGFEGAGQSSADLAALAGARAMHAAHPRLFEPATIDGRSNPAHLDKADYLELGRDAAVAVGRRNGADHVEVTSPDERSIAPVQLRVRVTRRLEIRFRSFRRELSLDAAAVAELVPDGGGSGLADFASGGGYDGPLAHRQGKPMRPDVALAFDRLEQAARADGVALMIVSGFRSDAEQAVLFARNPNPRMVARPGTSLHRNGTELDLGPRSAYGWLAGNAKRFGFIQRYSWEAWHYGFTLNPRSTPRRTAATLAGDAGGGGAADDSTSPGAADGSRSVPGFVPPRFAPLLARAAQRWSVSATLLAAQIYAESNFNPFARSHAGAQGIAQFMPGTARDYGLDDPFDAAAAINAQAHMMRDLLRQFGSVPLALAAYNAGPARVSACGCIPPYPETRSYVAKILGLMGGAGEILTGGDSGLKVRLIE